MKKAAVIVGRFQVVELQESQIEILTKIKESHDSATIVLGLANQRSTANNPLDFKCRKAMIHETFPGVDVRYIEDCRNDTDWSLKLDRQIQRWYPKAEVTIYGSQDGLVDRYTGGYEFEKLDSEIYTAPSEMMRQIKSLNKTDFSYRCGVFAAANDRWPTAYQTVDIAVFNETGDKILLAQKPGEDRWRFFGGFADPNSPSLEADARREVMEEGNIEITDPVYLASTKIEDSRYRGERDCIKTALFTCKYLCGKPQGGDDVAVVAWKEFDQLGYDDIMRAHHILFDLLIKDRG